MTPTELRQAFEKETGSKYGAGGRHAYMEWLESRLCAEEDRGIVITKKAPEGVKTAEEVLMSVYGSNALDYQLQVTLNPDVKIIERAMSDYARQVAERVRQECADRAQVKIVEVAVNEYLMTDNPVVDRDSIMSVNVEQFIK